ncbi:MAG: nicotinate-nucleotide adenylyltransferase [Aquificaceae bacterium]|jgi:nicotinate-nucleotide adenylyltransferase|uniref:nicotinate-nucleotide adenylyltransferase n=1 Tax=Hydrogenobacter sp. Uz 6-8 TaxID=3384828 RepID=UPI000F2A1647|nr:MAG: nicotinate (nicotinamide) nucleotide adenylyltransferase [Aquificota bacterium]
MKLFFGGSFDPVHLGHLLVARDVREAMDFESVVFVPAHQAPLKEPHMASPEDRLEMLKLSVEGLEGFEVSSMEVERGGISYTVDTARELYAGQRERPFFLVGADSFLSLHLWREPHELISLARFVVVDREGKWERLKRYIKENFPKLREGEDFYLLSVRRIDISSTEIRERLKNGRSIRWMVPEKVEDYILARGLYTSNSLP